MIKSVLQEIPPPPKPEGKYIIELSDAETGEVQSRVESDNYISPLWELYLSGLQYANPYWAPGLAEAGQVIRTNLADTSANSVMGSSGPYTDRFWNPLGVGPLPQDSLIITNDDTTEDPTDHWLKGDVIGWATRWKANVDASGKRGQINEAECGFSNNGNTHKTVWDFTTQQANGEFQTLAIGAMSSFGNPADPTVWCAMGPHCVIVADSVKQTYPAANFPCQSHIHLVNDRLNWLHHATNSVTAAVAVYSLPVSATMEAAALPFDSLARDATGQTPEQRVTLAMNFANAPATAGQSTASPTSSSRMGLARMGAAGDWVVAYTGFNGSASSSANGRQLRIRRFTAAGAAVWGPIDVGPVSGSNINAGQISVAWDGTHLFVSCATGDNTIRGNIWRVDPADGSASATIALPAGAFVNAAGMVFHDGHLYVSTDKGVLKLNPDGSPASPFNYGSVILQSGTETALSPWPTTSDAFGWDISRSVIGWTTVRGGVHASTSPSVYNNNVMWGTITPARGVGSPTDSGAGGQGMFIYGGKLWRWFDGFISAGQWAIDGYGGVILGATGANCLSRTLLDSPVTKNSSQNMKITYEITWPMGNTLARAHDHRAI